ncbi:UDP-N-acetylglucosamine 1-carboxyvinyltransferase [Malonomonas rubra DSM 5091]|uniref:UDP-N-acetylglucosamine 1-carboxyvinyltransferase n=1 Tax=Malonomonas rubra DSM 5091 TaxID=1122189 RepID=A0A1M6FAK0_MALRU|nr:UDP-N-acetylglucosamine 1-carboxyvinyltransferase [Malonomonas rubra]SHI94788.1 UDP-N-acetylglucosamine 1-carboxyvinyltransferase [Malonomonas rubra DSM 5091]
MDKIVIKGGVPLNGEVQVSGAKNSALPLLFATLLAEGQSEICNIPDLRDINTAVKLLCELGADAGRVQDCVRVDACKIASIEAPYDLVKTMRASVLVLGPLLARFGHARVSLPGGCAIGARPIDQHLKGFEALGAEITLDHGYVEAKAEKLVGAKINFDMPTVGGTENLLMAAALAEGETVLENAAREPEIVQLADALNSMGAKIEGAGTAVIRIQGVEKLQPLECSVIPDRIEAGTFMIAAAITGGNVLIKGAVREHQEALIGKMVEAGVRIEEEADGLRVVGPGKIRSVDIRTSVFPGFPTDMQAQFMALMTRAEGSSRISETVFENRFMHVGELQRMGADILIDGNSAIIRGVEQMTGAPVMATDLRASASLILAGLASENTTEVSRIYHLDRGYEKIEKKLAALGANVWREKE